MILAQKVLPGGSVMSTAEVRAVLMQGLQGPAKHQKVLVLIPDATRTLPLPMLFRQLVEVLADARQIDFMVALGTHPPLDEAALCSLVGISRAERAGKYRHIGLLNHAWDQPSALASLGSMDSDELRTLAGDCWHPSLPEKVDVSINRAALEHDQILLLAPTFPHEVAGFSGGAKYLFPGISGAEMIHATHWLGALSGVVKTIGFADTPVRRMIHAAASRLATPVTLAAMVVEEQHLSALIVGDLFGAWEQAASLSAERHIHWCETPFQRVLSCAPPMYDELWTAAKAMYKLEPAVALGGEVVIHAPHLETVSRVHGRYIHEVGYHILPYFLEHWEQYKHIPLGVLAHSTHLRGSGVMHAGQERPNVRVTLASRIPPEECARLNLGYLDPASVRIEDWSDREAQGILMVPRAGEILYRLRREQ